jgi:lipopolysaccharide biosynthesis glycosyltransferase
MPRRMDTAITGPLPGMEVHRNPIAATHPQGMAEAPKTAAAVAFCADRFMETPLHVAASSLLRNLRSDYAARFYFLLTGFSERDIDCLRRSLERTSRACSIRILGTQDIHVPAGLPALHGSFTTYYRLFLPELVEETRLLYLDADLLVNVDISPLFEADMGTKPAGFVVGGAVRHSLDGQFQISIGRSPDGLVLNAGVMLFNLPEWRRQRCSAAVWEFGMKHRTELVSHDQSILRALFADDCYHLPPEFNFQLTAESRAQIPQAAIIHYVGSPKPWDIGARLLLPYADQWFNALRRTAVPFVKRTAWLSPRSWARVPRILGGYRRALQFRLRSFRGGQ